MSATPISGTGHPRARRHLFHPPRRRLLAWLEGDEPELDDHLATCARCADRLEAGAVPVGPVADALLAILAPPADLAPRLRAGIASRMQARADLAMLAQMMGVPAETLALMADAPPEEDGDAGSR